MDILRRNNVQVRGKGAQAIIFAHGFGCDQHMWRHVAPAFEGDYRVVLFDHVGHGQSDASAFAPGRYQTLAGYAEDVREIGEALELRGSIFVGHSVSGMIGLLAAQKDPGLFSRLAMIGPSPRYVNDGDYVGGFSEADVHGMLDFLDTNHLGWSSAMAPAIMGNPDRPELGSELANSFCRTNPEIARHFARVTFLSDNRADLAKANVPTLIMQCADDVIAPRCVGEYMQSRMPGSRLVYMQATGHCPNLSHPEETVRLLREYLESTAAAAPAG